ncbi:MAG: hypothetical protein Q9178_006778 [Gyalolechia marmorata]
MVSRPNKMTPKPLDVAGRCKPMRVEKQKRARTHKVKQGTPPKLSASQKRKLVRLYVLTNLSWKAIERLVCHFGRKDIKKRALQYTLQNLLSAQYNHMRPKDAPARRKRTTQFQKYKDLERARKNEHQESGRILQPANVCLPPATQGDVDDPDKPDISTTLGPLTPPEMAEADLSYLNEFDTFIDFHGNGDTSGQSLIGDFPLFPDTSMTTSASSHFDLGVDVSVPQIPESGAPVSYADAIDSAIGLESSRRHDLLQPYVPSSLGARSEDHLIAWDEAFRSPNNQPTPFKEHDDLQMTRFAASDAGQPIQSTTKQCAMESDTRDLLPSISQHQGLTSVLPPRKSASSDASGLVDDLSECSSGGKRFIKDALSSFSFSTTFSSIHGSDGSIYSFRPAESVTDRMVRIVKPASSPSKRRAVSPGDFITSNIKSWFWPAESATDRVLRIDKPASSPSERRAVLPGDFITSNINTFRKHIHCAISKAASCESRTFCRSCFQDIGRNNAREIWCIPFAVILFKRGVAFDKIWFAKGNPWFVDRFGNTSLHIAAALGATYEELQDIISRGVSVELLNSAGQTFMHLLNPSRGAVNDLLSLTNDLKRFRFKFGHRDVLGHTFIDSLELRSMRYPETRYPETRSPEMRPRLDFSSLRTELCGIETTSWITLPCTESVEERFYDGSTTLRELLEVPRDSLHRFINFVDVEGRNSLQIAVNNKQKPLDLSEHYFNDSLIRDLLGMGVEVDHHESSGETPLMTQIRTLPSQDNIILLLLRWGADPNARNKMGEAALHISIKVGSIIGTKALLEQRTIINVNVRNQRGEGVLAVGLSAQRQAKDDISLYARTTACMALATDFGAIASPSLFDEWDMRIPIDPKLPALYDKHGGALWKHS